MFPKAIWSEKPVPFFPLISTYSHTTEHTLESRMWTAEKNQGNNLTGAILLARIENKQSLDLKWKAKGTP